MGSLADLRQDILRMTPEERLQKIREIRSQRKIVHNPVRVAKEKKAKATNMDKLKKELSNLTKEEMIALGLVEE